MTFLILIKGNGKCGAGTLDMNEFGQNRQVIGMVYLDEKEFWVFFVKSVSFHIDQIIIHFVANGI
jgi:hypothetical protein